MPSDDGKAATTPCVCDTFSIEPTAGSSTRTVEGASTWVPVAAACSTRVDHEVVVGPVGVAELPWPEIDDDRLRLAQREEDRVAT